jgi:hypothetical protein
MTLVEWYVARASGIVAFALLTAAVILGLANRYRKRLPYRFWRRAPYLNFAVWGLALVQGLVAGTDRGSAWAGALYISSAALVAGLMTGAWAGTSAAPADVPIARAG